MRTRWWIIIGSLAGVALAGCEEKGPARKMGERIDKFVDELTGKGPAEKVGSGSTRRPRS